MRARGITYDTGFFNAGTSTHEPYEAGHLQRDLRAIRHDLHCDAVRLTGGSVDRLETAAELAVEAGLKVWLSPFTCDLTTAQLLDLLADCAGRAERLRRDGAGVVLLAGSELSLFTIGFLPGATLEERLRLLAEPAQLLQALPLLPSLTNDFLSRALAAVRGRFGGPVSYASLPFEGVDWTPFDVIATDAGYRSRENAARFREDVQAFVEAGRKPGKPVAVTEFGCVTHRGAADLGGRGASIVEWEGGRAVGLKGELVRDEAEQAAYVAEVLEVLLGEEVEALFVNTFASYHLPHRADPRQDLDLASYGVVRVLEGDDGPRWEAKAAFAALADLYRSVGLSNCCQNCCGLKSRNPSRAKGLPYIVVAPPLNATRWCREGELNPHALAGNGF